MERPVQITSRDFPLTEAMKATIQHRAEALEHFFEGLTGCHVVIEAPVHHHRRGGPFSVRIDLRTPGAELSVNKQDADDLEVAIREAFDSARRRLEVICVNCGMTLRRTRHVSDLEASDRRAQAQQLSLDERAR
jgi:ribosome-associated translation inhibitor RaiA